jgi:hypothetical protein
MINKVLLGFVMLTMLLTGCGEKADTPESVAAEFWQAVIDKDMETAKTLASWDTVDYLRYIRSGQLKPARFELGEITPGDRRAVIETTLHSQPHGQSSIRIPGQTVLIKTKQGWRVDLKETIGSTVKETVGTVFDQLNNIMKQGLQGLDKELSNSMKEVEKALKEGVNELQKELSKPPFNGDLNSQPEPPSEGQRI